MTTCEKQFVQLLRSVVSDEKAPVEVDWPGVWHLARRHHLETMVWEIAKSDPTLPDALKAQMNAAHNKMAARDIRQSWCLQQIEEALCQAQIPYSLLKGAILKNDYPQTCFRFMSDLDFYIRPADRPEIRRTIEGIHGAFRGTESGDEQFLFWDTIGVEFHGRLLYRKGKTGIESYPDWQFVDTRRNRLTEEGYALNLIGHAVHDLAGSGPGIRYILDLWMYRNRHQPQPDWDAVDARLKKDNIYGAAHNLLNLSEYLFGDGKEAPLMLEMADYVLKGGLYGDYKRGLTSQAANEKAVWKQLFRNRTEFENRYPWLKKYPYLLPAAWGIRLVQSFKNHREIISNWNREVKKIDQQEIEAQKERLKKFGL